MRTHCPQYFTINSFQVELKVGDVIGVAGNHWDGFNKGRNHRSVTPQDPNIAGLNGCLVSGLTKLGFIQSTRPEKDYEL